ncbi:phosphatase and actin regulator 2 [Trichonephila clavipes]|nr:phosphatase and actin regulator 2 [Trichonephila clavipes]
MSIIREKCSDIVLCKKVKGAMKTSSVDSNSRTPTPSPMERNIIGLRCSGDSSSPGSGNGGKRDRFEQTSRTLERKISMRSTKEFIKKSVLMPDGSDKNQDSKINIFLWNLPDVEEVPSHDGETV